MGTISSTQHHPTDTQDVLSPNFSRALVAGVAYGLVGWFHMVLCAAYAIAGMVPASTLSSVYGTTPTVWGVTYVVTGGVMVVVAIGLVQAHGWAWRVAPWAVAPSLVAHCLFIVVLPIWGAAGIATDLLVLAVVLVERPRVQTGAPVTRRFRRPSLRREAPHLLGNGRST